MPNVNPSMSLRRIHAGILWAFGSWEPETSFHKDGPLLEVWRQLEEQGWSRRDFERTSRDLYVSMDRTWVGGLSGLACMICY